MQPIKRLWIVLLILVFATAAFAGPPHSKGVSPSYLRSTNGLTDNYVPSYDATTKKFTWVDNGAATSITDGIIIEPDLNADNAPAEDDVLTYDATGTNFAWLSPAELQAKFTAGSYTDDTVNSADINWADIGNLGEDGIAIDYALAADADAGDFDVHSTDGIYGASDTEYIDLGGDLVEVVSDTKIQITSPAIELGYDADSMDNPDSYLTVATADGGVTVISQTSSGTDGITLGDGTDNVIISADNWSVDTSGNASFDGTISAAANATPYYTFLDDDCLGTDKDIARVGGNYLSGADGAEDGALLLEAMLAGAQVLVGAWDSDEETWTFGDSGTGEDLIWDFETAVDNQVEVSSNSSVTQIDFGSIQLNAYAKTYVASGAITVTEKSAYVICTGACQVTLPASVAGSQYYIRNAPGSATIINLVNRASQYYELTDHSAWATANQKLTSGGVATDAISIVGYDATHYATMNYTGTWTDTAP